MPVVRLGWGPHAARAGGKRGDVVVLVDTLRFSTTCAVAAERGITVVPLASGTEGREYLSPIHMATLQAGTELRLSSPNGATCTTLAGSRAVVGTIVNASAAAGVAGVGDITVVACGERWPDDDSLRVALEDLLGAGAIVARLPPSLERDAEARAAEAAWNALAADIEAVLLDCPSGRELVEKGRIDDVRFAARLDAIAVAPRWDGLRIAR